MALLKKRCLLAKTVQSQAATETKLSIFHAIADCLEKYISQHRIKLKMSYDCCLLFSKFVADFVANDHLKIFNDVI